MQPRDMAMPEPPTTMRSQTTTADVAVACHRRAREVESDGDQVLAVGASFEYASTIDEMQAVYDTMRGLVATSPVRAWIRDCGHRDPALADAARRAQNQTQLSWHNIQTACRTELAAYGFRC